MIPLNVENTIWDDLPTAYVDTTKLEHLFESRAKELLTKVSFKLVCLIIRAHKSCLTVTVTRSICVRLNYNC